MPPDVKILKGRFNIIIKKELEVHLATLKTLSKLNLQEFSPHSRKISNIPDLGILERLLKDYDKLARARVKLKQSRLQKRSQPNTW